MGVGVVAMSWMSSCMGRGENEDAEIVLLL
jgi:hypothetical protein